MDGLISPQEHRAALEARIQELEGMLQATKDALREVLKTSAIQARELQALRVTCGGPDCKMIELHTVGSCPTHPEDPPTLVGWNESEAWYDNPEEEEGGCPFCKPHPNHYAECPIVNDDGDQCRCNNPQ